MKARRYTVRKARGALMAQLWWFHAFNRILQASGTGTDIPAVVDVLRNGPKVFVNPNSGTQKAEQRLGIRPPRVYAYLGRTRESFGTNCVVLDPDGISRGEMSPFDTGGLLDFIKPVCDLPTDKGKSSFMAAFTFDIRAKANELDVYPTYDAQSFKDYIECKAPAQGDGPHDRWPRSADHELPVWKSNADWRAWTWEARTLANDFAIGSLLHWTCHTNIYRRVMAEARRKYPKERVWLLALADKYVQGATGTLVAALRSKQIAA